MKFAGVVKSSEWHTHPFGAVGRVIVTVHVPVVPDRKEPAVAPPTVVEFEQPDAVNFVPADTRPPLSIWIPAEVTLKRSVVLEENPSTFAEIRYMPLAGAEKLVAPVTLTLSALTAPVNELEPVLVNALAAFFSGMFEDNAPSGNPVAFVRTRADGVPKAGVINVGEVASTTEPDPVVVATVAAGPKATVLVFVQVIAEDAPAVVQSPLKAGNAPAGSPVALVSVIAEGVPRFGVVSVGEVASTRLPVPVAVVVPDPP